VILGENEVAGTIDLNSCFGMVNRNKTIVEAGIHFITPVWGEAHTKCFAEVCLPTLLAPGNIPSLSNAERCVYNIYTSPDDQRVIEHSVAYKRLVQYLQVLFHPLPAEVDKITNRYFVQSDCYRNGITAADKVGAAMIFLNADVIVADGGIRALLDIAKSGKRAILAMGVRLIKENIVPYLLEHYRSKDGSVISITPRELVAVALPNLHPISKTHLYHGEGEGFNPAGLFWRVGDQGILARCFHLHPVMVYPKIKYAPFSITIDEDYLVAACPDWDETYVVQDSDQFCAFELSNADRRIPAMQRSSPLGDIIRWATSYSNAYHRHFVRYVIRIHCSQSNRDWDSIQRESDRVIFWVRLGLLLAALRQRIRKNVTLAENYLDTKGIMKQQFPWSLFKMLAAATVIAAFLILRSGVRGWRRARQFLQG